MEVDLAFSDTGVGSPLVVLHGLFGSRRNWAGIAAKLSGDHRVLSVDLRNHGESPHAIPHDYPALAADVARLIRTRVGGPAGVLGHSMGGKVAMVLALEHPDLVERLVVVDIAPARSRGEVRDYLRAMREVSLSGHAQRTTVSEALASAIPDPKTRGFLVQNLAAGPDGLRWTIGLDALDRHIDDIVDFPKFPAGRRYDGPCLFVAGGRSDFIRAEHRPAIVGLFPRAEIVVIEAAGHWVHADAPGPFVDTVARFLAAAPTG